MRWVHLQISTRVRVLVRLGCTGAFTRRTEQHALSPSLIGHLASVDLKQHESKMNTDAHHSGKAHSTHGFTRASATHGRYTQKHNHKAQHSYRHSHSLRNTARVHTESQQQNTPRYKISLKMGNTTQIQIQADEPPAESESNRKIDSN